MCSALRYMCMSLYSSKGRPKVESSKRTTNWTCGSLTGVWGADPIGEEARTVPEDAMLLVFGNGLDPAWQQHIFSKAVIKPPGMGVKDSWMSISSQSEGSGQKVFSLCSGCLFSPTGKQHMPCTCSTAFASPQISVPAPLVLSFAH